MSRRSDDFYDASFRIRPGPLRIVVDVINQKNSELLKTYKAKWVNIDLKNITIHYGYDFKIKRSTQISPGRNRLIYVLEEGNTLSILDEYPYAY